MATREMQSETVPPSAEYSKRLRAREAQIATLDLTSQRISNVRVALAVLFVIAVWWSSRSASFDYWWVLPAVLFLAAVIYHSRVRRAHARAERAAAHYRAGMARIEDRWSGQGNPGTRFDDPHHVYAADLDLFGPGNLFELLSIARTRMGENALARGCCLPPPSKRFVERQQSVAELRERLDLREDLAVLGEDQESACSPMARALGGVAESAEQALGSCPSRCLLPLLRASRRGVSGSVGPRVAIRSRCSRSKPACCGCSRKQLTGHRQHRKGVRQFETAGGADRAAGARAIHSRALQAADRQLVVARDLRASHASRGSATVVQFVESRRNPILAVLDLPLMYRVHAALAGGTLASRSRRTRCVSWLQTIGEIEALISLSGLRLRASGRSVSRVRRRRGVASRRSRSVIR